MTCVQEFLSIVTKYKKNALSTKDIVQERRNLLFLKLAKRTHESKEFGKEVLDTNHSNQIAGIKQIKELGYKYFQVKDENIENYNDEEIISRYYIYSAALSILNNNIRYYNLILDFFKKKDGVYIEPSLILEMLLCAKTNDSFSAEKISTIIGLMVKRFPTDVKVPNAEDIQQLAKFYNNDGSINPYINQTMTYPCYSDYAYLFSHTLNNFNKVLVDYVLFLDPPLTLNFQEMFAEVINYFLNVNNALIVNNLKNIPKEEKSIQESITINPDPTKALNYLNKYYQNFYFINIPTDLDCFLKNLEFCPISNQEKEYILANLEDINNDDLKDNFKDNNLRIYLKALQILSSLNYNDEFYIKIKQEINNLKETLILLEDCYTLEDKQIITEEIDQILAKLDKRLARFTKDLIPHENLIFLQDGQTPFFAEDIQELGRDYLNSSFVLLEDLRTNNTLPKVLLPSFKGFTLPIYSLNYQDTNLYYVAIAKDINAVVGVTNKDIKPKKILNRIYRYKDILEDYATRIFNHQRRNEILNASMEDIAKLQKIKTDNVIEI